MAGVFRWASCGQNGAAYTSFIPNECVASRRPTHRRRTGELPIGKPITPRHLRPEFLPIVTNVEVACDGEGVK